MTLTQWLAIWFIASVVSAPFIGNLLHKRRVRLNSQECRRLETLCDLADEFEAAPTDAERKRIYIKASALGFTDDREPFHLDDQDSPNWNNPEAKALRERGYKRINDPRAKPEQPHLPKAS